MRLSFPEAEVTRSLSSNLLKYGFNFGWGGEEESKMRIIDTNELVEKRLEELAAAMRAPENAEFAGGFVEGIRAEDVSALLADGNGSGENTVIKAAQADGVVLLDQARSEADQIIADARNQARTIVQDAVEQAELSKKSVFDEARMKGYRDGGDKAKAEVENIKKEYEMQKMALEAEYQKQLDEMEPLLVETITGIYEHLFHVELHSYKEILTYLIVSTLHKAEGSRQFLVHVSKEDYSYVSMQKKQIIASALGSSATMEIIEDMSLNKNECMIETEGGIFDCGLGTQLSELRQKLMLLSYTK